MKAAGAAVALLIAAWLAVQAVGAHAQDELTRIVFAARDPTPAQRARALTLIERAERLNPDRRPEFMRGALLLREGNARGAAAVFARVTREEPESLEAWALLERAARAYDPALAAQARARARALAPPVPR